MIDLDIVLWKAVLCYAGHPYVLEANFVLWKMFGKPTLEFGSMLWMIGGKEVTKNPHEHSNQCASCENFGMLKGL